MNRVFSFFSLFLAALCLWAVQGLASEAISDPGHRQQLESVMHQASQLEQKNLNRFAMEALYRYNKLYDSLYQAEKKDTLSRMAATFQQESSERRRQADSLSAVVAKATTDKEALRVKYMKLLRKSVIALVAWLVIVSVVITVRTKTMRRNKKLLDGSQAALESYTKRFQDGEGLLSLGVTLQPVHAELSSQVKALQALQEEVKQQIKSGDLDAASHREFQAKLGEVATLLEKQDSILFAIRGQREPETEAKVEVDLNSLCRYYLNLANSGMTSEEFDCKITTDFEKRLPPIKVFPQSIGNLLNHLFSNAYDSMLAKAAHAGKTYKPTLAVSTRVLPRFIQVRIKDNGTGILDEELEKIFDYFYSLNPPSLGAGIGLAEANRIMKEMHNGEIAMESDPERGTDVYLKFYT